MKVIIAGSRTFDDYNYLQRVVHEVIGEFEVHEIVSGKARGADALGEAYAREFKIPIKEFPANWDQYGKAAGPIRNQQMADYADVLIAFIEKGSKGTLNMITTAAKKPMETHVFPF